MDIKKIRIVYMGTPEISAFLLESLINNGYNIIGVIAQPDKPVGRKNKIVKVPTKVIAEKYNIPVYQPIKIRNDFEFLYAIKPDLILTMAYGQIVPQGLLDIPKFGSLNFHGSLLPKYRGASPVQQCLINGDSITGVTLMQMINKMDAGLMYAKKEIIIDSKDNSTSLFQKIAICSSQLALEFLPKYINGELIGEPQNENEVSFCSIIKKEEEKLDLSLPISIFVGWVKALSEVPGGYVFIENEKFKLLNAKIINCNFNHELGTIISCDKNGVVLQCNGGEICITEIQKEGKKKMDASAFANGNKYIIGKIAK